MYDSNLILLLWGRDASLRLQRAKGVGVKILRIIDSEEVEWLSGWLCVLLPCLLVSARHTQRGGDCSRRGMGVSYFQTYVYGLDFVSYLKSYFFLPHPHPNRGRKLNESRGL